METFVQEDVTRNQYVQIEINKDMVPDCWQMLKYMFFHST
jgi:hypothetical protein